MAPPRISPAALARLLDAAAEPIYVLDGERRIVFLNQACRAWVGPVAEQLVGQTCQYHSQPHDDGGPPLADLLCPPPAVFGGHRTTAVVTLPSGDDLLPRRVEFRPLAGDGDELAGVLCLVDSAEPDDPTDAATDGLEPEQLHTLLQRHRLRAKSRYRADRLIGSSAALARVRAQIVVAAGCSASVSIAGPPGSGRQHVAKSIHYGSIAAAPLGPLVPLAGPLLQPDLLAATIESLVRAAATAPPNTRPGTLLINDIDEMSAASQAALTAALAGEGLPFRIITTASEPLVPLAAVERFHAELAGRLSTLVIELPPLAERVEDLPLLAQMFLEEQNAAGGKQLGGFMPEALDALAAYRWPGQIDELADAVADAHARAEGSLVAPGDLPSRLHHAETADRYARKAEETIDLEDFLAGIERRIIERALARAKGNKARVARLLGMTRPRLYRRLVQLGFETDDDGPIFEEET